MDLRKLECFIAVARHLHFGRAAEAMGTKQSVVSESIASIEALLGGKLFDRTSRRVALTPLGHALLKDVAAPVDSIKTALRDARQRAGGHKIEVTVGYLGGGFYEFTSLVVAEFARMRPDTSLRFVELNYLNQGFAVLDGKVDVALARLPLSTPGLLRGATLFKDARTLVVPTGHRLARLELVDPEELQFERMARLPAGAASDDWCDFHFPRFTPAGQAIADGPEISTVREGLAAVASGTCVMTLTSRARQYFTHPGVEYVAIDLPPVESALSWSAVDRRSALLDLDAAARLITQRSGS